MNIFETAEQLATEKGKKRLVKKVVNEPKRLIIKRGSEVIERKVEEKKFVGPVFKKKVAKVDMEKVYPESNDPKEQRAELGKRVYNERVELLFILNRSYGVSMGEIECDSLEELKDRMNLEKVKEAKRLRFVAAEKPQAVGDLLEDFDIVSSVSSSFREEEMGGTLLETVYTIGGRRVRIGGEPMYKVDEE